MSNIHVLRDEYPGDAAWANFLAVFAPDWLNWPNKELYQNKLGGWEFAATLTPILGEFAIDWYDQPCCALDNRSPSDVLKNDGDGERVLRALIMRMPR